MKNTLNNINEDTLELFSLTEELFNNKDKLSDYEQISTLKDILTLSVFTSNSFMEDILGLYNPEEWNQLDRLIRHANLIKNSIESNDSQTIAPRTVANILNKVQEYGGLGLFPFIIKKHLSVKYSDLDLENEFNKTLEETYFTPLALNKNQKSLLQNLIKPGVANFSIECFKTTNDMLLYNSINEIKIANKELLIEIEAEELANLSNDIIEEELELSNEEKKQGVNIVSDKLWVGGLPHEGLQESTHKLKFEDSLGLNSVLLYVEANNSKSANEEGILALKKLAPEYFETLNLVELYELEKADRLNDEKSFNKNVSSLDQADLDKYNFDISFIKAKYSKKSIPSNFNDKSKSIKYDSSKGIQDVLYQAIYFNDYETVQELLLDSSSKNDIDLKLEDGLALRIAKERQEATGFTSILRFLNLYVDNQNNPLSDKELNKIDLFESELSIDELSSLWEMTILSTAKNDPNLDTFLLLQSFVKENNIDTSDIGLLSKDLPTVKEQITVADYLNNVVPEIKPKVTVHLDSSPKPKIRH